jgi:hypothetical protein
VIVSEYCVVLARELGAGVVVAGTSCWRELLWAIGLLCWRAVEQAELQVSPKPLTVILNV